MSLTQAVAVSQVIPFVFGSPPGSVVALGGIDTAELRALVDQAEGEDHGRRALFVRMPPAAQVSTYIELLIDIMADTALRLWPVWFTDVSFAMCLKNTLGRQAALVIAGEAAARVPEVSASWVEAAVQLALSGQTPRVAGTLPAVELKQLSRTISRTGMVLVAEVASDEFCASALLHALEWIAMHSLGSVIALFGKLPSPNSPFDRILHGARQVRRLADNDVSDPSAKDGTGAWLAPWRGAPHPLSEVEQRLSAMLSIDSELGGLFHFNWTVPTVRDARPRVDLVWLEGKLVVELDGYLDHSTRHAFIADRHRDYELTLSGYIVLRLANDEVMQDYGRAIHKIRDLVRLRRSTMTRER